VCHNPHGGGVFATNDQGGFGIIGVCDTGVGVHGKGGRLAGEFEGDVHVTGKLLVDDDIVLTGGTARRNSTLPVGSRSSQGP
jgi:hypothetical protein